MTENFFLDVFFYFAFYLCACSAAVGIATIVLLDVTIIAGSLRRLLLLMCLHLYYLYNQWFRV